MARTHREYTMYDMTFAEKLTHLLAARNLPQEHIRRLFGSAISAATVSNWCNGKGPLPRIDEALKIARAFDVELDYLADDSLDEPPAKSDLRDSDEEFLLQISRRVGVKQAIDRILNPATPVIRPANPPRPGQP